MLQMAEEGTKGSNQQFGIPRAVLVSTVLNEARHIRRANASKIHASLLEPLVEKSLGESYVVGRRALRQLPFLYQIALEPCGNLLLGADWHWLRIRCCLPLTQKHQESCQGRCVAADSSLSLVISQESLQRARIDRVGPDAIAFKPSAEATDQENP